MCVLELKKHNSQVFMKNEVLLCTGLDYSEGVDKCYPHVSIRNSKASLAHGHLWDVASCLWLFSIQTVLPIWQ